MITPDIKYPGESSLVFVDLGFGKNRLGATALAQCFSQMGDECPDLTETDALVSLFRTVQSHIKAGVIASGHDRSDGGLITTLLEMAFTGDCGINIIVEDVQNASALEYLFSEEVGCVVEVLPKHLDRVTDDFKSAGLDCRLNLLRHD